MTFPLRAVLAFVLLIGGFIAAFPKFVETAGVNIWKGITEVEPPAHGEQEPALEGVNQARQRQEMRHIVIHELVEDRMNLADAIDHFYDLDQAEPEIMAQTRRRFPAESDQITVGLQVICHADAYLLGESSRRTEVARRLNRELAAMRHENLSSDD